MKAMLSLALSDVFSPFTMNMNKRLENNTQVRVTSLSALGVIIYDIIVLYIAKFVSPEIL